MAETKAVITLILAPKLLAALTVEAAKSKRSRNNYINLLLEQRHAAAAQKTETK